MIYSIIFFILAFIFNAIGNTLKFHWSTSIFYSIKNKKINDWLNPNSWKWMYKNGDKNQGEVFWGSSRWFAPLIDGWHFFKMLELLSFISVLTFYSNYLPFTYRLLDTFLIYVLYGLIFELFFSKLLIKKYHAIH